MRPVITCMTNVLTTALLSSVGYCRIEREKFYPGPGLEPWPLALRASPLTTTLSRTSADPR